MKKERKKNTHPHAAKIHRLVKNKAAWSFCSTPHPSLLFYFLS